MKQLQEVTMRKFVMSVLGVLVLAATSVAYGADFTEGKDYFLVQPAQRTSVAPGKIEVAEVFSYGCPYCNRFQPVAEQIRKSLPANAQLIYVPASFNPPEDWPMFQRAFLAAQALGIADKTHAPMFSAVWTTGELGISDPRTNRLKNPLPSIEDAAKFYARVGGVTADQFLAAAKSFSVEMNIKRTDDWIKAARVDGTPTMIVNGKYRVTVTAAGGDQKLVEVVKYLVAKEGGR
jgi:thiol:disulfide interchange protein DsbA